MGSAQPNPRGSSGRSGGRAQGGSAPLRRCCEHSIRASLSGSCTCSAWCSGDHSYKLSMPLKVYLQSKEINTMQHLLGLGFMLLGRLQTASRTISLQRHWRRVSMSVVEVRAVTSVCGEVTHA